MGRLTEAERLPMLDAHIGHWTQADGVAGTLIELEPGFGLAQQSGADLTSAREPFRM